MNDTQSTPETPLIARFIGGIFSLIFGAIFRIFSYILSMAIFAAICYYGAIYTKENHPELIDKARDYVRANAQPYIKNVLEFAGLTPQNGQARFTPEQINAALATLGNADPALQHRVPSNLAAVAQVLQTVGRQDIIQQHLTTQKVGNDGAGAIPFLEKMLKSSNPQLHNAAYQSLLRIDNPQARSILAAYDQANQ